MTEIEKYRNEAYSGDSILLSFQKREIAIKKWGYPVITTEILNEILSLDGNIVDAGCGTGYLVYCLQRQSIINNIKKEIIGFDKYEINKNLYGFDKQWLSFKITDIEDFDFSSFNILILSWPPYNNDFAFKSLSAFKGEYVVYIGESMGGCTGDDNFFQAIYNDWEEVNHMKIPVWIGMHDAFYVYKRK